MKQYTFLLLNTLTLIGVLIVNYLAGTGAIAGTTVGEVSAQYETPFTPAGYAFGIWGIIYLMLVAFVAYQWVAWVRDKKDHELRMTGIWFMLSNLFNASWIFAWLNGYFGLSVILVFLMLATLLILMFRLRLETWDAPVRIIAFVWWPICIYLGWLVTATVANVAVYLESIGWEAWGFSDPSWAITMIIVATLIYIFLVFTRNLREAAAVGIWALAAIAVKQWDAYSDVATTAVVCSIALFVLISYHGYRNRETSPFKKLQRGEV